MSALPMPDRTSSTPSVRSKMVDPSTGRSPASTIKSTDLHQAPSPRTSSQMRWTPLAEVGTDEQSSGSSSCERTL
eukprot:CAMPEP_0182597222 /NCGR_PEP_ID=MMETSP1324-20130603/85789_1 /TAXON_ID=236786 /ORGANISM="Florenciella sp., Strain RCC1587" /LENGTH=74 /DNA_ID=CAMNT_0024814955 /DNA_START=82 /DNA_END=306 /DNA_ORIENTATION=+